MSLSTLSSTMITTFNLLAGVLKNPEAQSLLVKCYAASQAEHMRNDKLGMEVGNAREKDLVAVLTHYLGSELEYNIDNDLTEDFRIQGRRISVKHITISSKTQDITGTCKCKWTADVQKAEQYIADMRKQNPETFTDILFGFINPVRKTLTYVLTPSEVVQTGVGLLDEKAFVSRTGTNNRGVEFSKDMMSYMCDNAYFKQTISGVDLSGGIDPIRRRLLMISTILGPSVPQGSPTKEEPHSQSACSQSSSASGL